ncbi:tRNA (adenosine(37)-N6)-threonylcarbamoyltransferase complex transferase subunit TsaD [Candidatus Gottesmanbacteria bacterium]|nr:tRNA (adenosine(37)-N6)-threonylcarbamoyltransferase complex transferase subunit TsaD [Candidatus Gottesmanbacteria bacterium]
MKILGIETSCDETAAAVVENGVKIISNVVASSQSLHAKSGGIIPENAAREQVKSIIPVIKECVFQMTQNTQTARLSESQTIRYSDIRSSPSFPKVEAIAVTVGPGLIGSLLVGVETAKTLALVWKKPIVPVNHLIGHIYANWLISENSENSENLINQKFRKSDAPSFPALVLLVSGGHTELILMKDHGKFKLLGSTRDDAAGECFDKGARILNLGYPGGPAIEAAASQLSTINYQLSTRLPRPMINQKNYDFSFSGLKTALANQLTNYPPNFLAYELQEAITDVLVKKTLRAAEEFKVKNILLAGGVAANSRLREKFQIPNSKFQIFCPPINLCTDNAAYIASAAFFNFHPVPWQKIEANSCLDF